MERSARMTDHTSIMAAARSVMCICWWVMSCTTPFMFLSAQVNTMLAWLLKMGRLKRCSASSRKRGSLTLLEVGVRVADGDVDKVLFPLDVDEPGTLGLRRRADAAHVEHVHGVAADGRGLGHDDLFGIGLLDLPDDRGHELRAGVDGGLGPRRVAGIGLQHHGAAGFDEVLDASEEGEDLGDHLLGVVPFGDGYDRLGHCYTSVVIRLQQPGEHVGRSFEGHFSVEAFQVAQILPPDPGEELGYDEVGLDIGADGALCLALLHEVGVPAEHLHRGAPPRDRGSGPWGSRR